MRRIPHTWATGIGKDITAVFVGISEILARLAEPLMRYSTIYLALATALPLINWMPLYNASMIVVIATPEFVLLGALAVAEQAMKEGRKKWGTILFIVCGLLAAIMIATFVEIFIIHFSELAVKTLNFCRCLTAVGFSIVLSKLAEPTINKVQSPALNPQIEQQLLNLAEQLNLLGQQVQKVQAELPEQVQSLNLAHSQEVQRLVQSFLSEHRVNTEPSLNMVQSASQAGLNQCSEPAEPVRIEPSEQVQRKFSEPKRVNPLPLVHSEPVRVEPVAPATEPVQIRVQRFITEQVNLKGSVPKLDEIVIACGCSKGSASSARSRFKQDSVIMESK